jgi:hypothetical protein
MVHADPDQERQPYRFPVRYDERSFLRPVLPGKPADSWLIRSRPQISWAPSCNPGGPRPCYDRMWELWMGRDFFTGTLVDVGLSPKKPIGGVAIASRRSWPPG